MNSEGRWYMVYHHLVSSFRKFCEGEFEHPHRTTKVVLVGLTVIIIWECFVVPYVTPGYHPPLGELRQSFMACSTNK
jgi:hypothetical protein